MKGRDLAPNGFLALERVLDSYDFEEEIRDLEKQKEALDEGHHAKRVIDSIIGGLEELANIEEELNESTGVVPVHFGGYPNKLGFYQSIGEEICKMAKEIREVENE